MRHEQPIVIEKTPELMKAREQFVHTVVGIIIGFLLVGIIWATIKGIEKRDAAMRMIYCN